MNLLSEADVAALRPSLELLREHRDVILATWYCSYVECFGDARSLSKTAFFRIHGRDIDTLTTTFLAGDLEGFEVGVRAIGFALAERAVPFAEVLASLHLFEESTIRHIGEIRGDSAVRGKTYLIFDKLSHCRIILLAEAYFTDRQADLGARLHSLESEADMLAGGPNKRATFHGIVGKAVAMRKIYQQIAAASTGDGVVMIVGDSGTGKELVARAVHECSSSASGPFVPVNCATLPRELIESELFGHRRGAYTGASDDYAGLIRAAAKGTLFLDEITEMPVQAQAKLLRVIEERAVRPVGATQEIAVDVRFVASTNRDPRKAVEARLLREDLWHRLNVHRITLPPLRERLEDLPLLTAHFMELFAKRGMRRVGGIDESTLAALRDYAWPGNVRELRNCIEHALIAGRASHISVDCLPAHVVGRRSQSPRPGALHGNRVPTMDEAECQLIQKALKVTGGNKLRAASLLQISRHRLYNKLRKFELTQ